MKKLTIAEMSPDQLRVFERDRKRAYRAKRAEQKQSNKEMQTQADMREVLADLAIMLLAVDGPGSSTIMAGLSSHYKERGGWPLKIQHMAKAGKLKPKVIGSR